MSYQGFSKVLPGFFRKSRSYQGFLLPGFQNPKNNTAQNPKNHWNFFSKPLEKKRPPSNKIFPIFYRIILLCVLKFLVLFSDCLAAAIMFSGSLTCLKYV